MEAKKKVNLIRKIANDNGITAYDIGKNTEISLTSARNVLEEDKISPRIKTLNIILEYLEKAIVGTKNKVELKEEYTTAFRNNIAAEAPENYPNFKDLKIDDKLDIIYQQNTHMEKIMVEVTNALSTIIIEIEKNSNKLEDIKNIK